MPTDPPSAETGRKGLRFIADVVEDMRFIHRELPQPDVGLDCQIEIKDDQFPTGQFVMVQSKAGRSYMQNLKPGSFDFYSDPNHLIYWRGCKNPVILVVYDPEGKVGYWKHVQGYLRQHPEIIEKRPHKIHFDRNKDCFTPATADALRGLFGPNHSETDKAFRDYVITKHSKLTLYSVTADRPLSVELEKVFVTLTTSGNSRYSACAVEVFDEKAGERRKVTFLRDKTPSGHGVTEYRLASLERFPLHLMSEALRTMAHVQHESAQSILSLNDALRLHPSLVIVGDPGAGKSTLLKYLALKFARNEAREKLGLDEQRLPILVPLRDFNVFLSQSFKKGEVCSGGPKHLPNFLHRHFLEIAPHLTIPDGFFADLLEAGRCVLLLDGLDEVADPSHRARMAELVGEIISSPLYRANRFVVTTRPTGYTGEPRARLSQHCADCTIRPFEDADVEQFTRSWYQAVTFCDQGETVESRRFADERADALIRSIKSEPRVRQLAQCPLLLSVLAMVHQRNIELPRLRARLYEECTDFLLGYWDETKGGDAARELARLGEFDRDGKRALLEPVALWLHERGEQGTEVDRAELENQFAAQFVKLGNEKTAARQKAKLFLQVIADRSGLLVERSTGVFAFAHLTFQEYLAARALADSDDGTARLLDHLHEPWWRETTLLYGSVLSDTRGGANTARRRTRAFLEAVRDARSWKENILRRDLLLAIRCMGDMETVGVDEDLRRTLTDYALTLWKKTEWDRQRDEVIAAFSNSVTTPQGQRLVDLLMNEIGRTKTSLCDCAAFALGGLGSAAATPAVLERLLALIQDANDDVSYYATFALGGLGSAAATPVVLEHLMALTQHDSAALRRAAASALGRLGSAAATPTVLERLLVLMQGADNDVRRSAASALGRLGNTAATPAVLECLLALTQAANYTVRCSAASALGGLGRTATTPVVLERLLALTQDTNLAVRSIAASALGYLGNTAATPTVLECLLALTQDADSLVRRNATHALGGLGSAVATPAVLERLLNLILNGGEDVDHTAAFALGRLGSAAATPAVVGRLLALMQDASEAVGAAAACALGSLDCAAATPAVLERLLALAQDDNDRIRYNAVEALGGLSATTATPAALERLLALTQDANDRVRDSAISALARFEMQPSLALEKGLTKFWEQLLPEKEAGVWEDSYTILGNCAYGQLQRLAVHAQQFEKAAAQARPRSSRTAPTPRRSPKQSRSAAPQRPRRH